MAFRMRVTSDIFSTLRREHPGESTGSTLRGGSQIFDLRVRLIWRAGRLPLRSWFAGRLRLKDRGRTSRLAVRTNRRRKLVSVHCIALNYPDTTVVGNSKPSTSFR